MQRVKYLIIGILTLISLSSSADQLINWRFTNTNMSPSASSGDATLVKEITNYDWSLYQSLWKEADGQYGFWANGSLSAQVYGGKLQFNAIQGFTLTEGQHYKVYLDANLNLWSNPTSEDYSIFSLGTPDKITEIKTIKLATGRQTLELDFTAPATSSEGFFRICLDGIYGQADVYSVRIEQVGGATAKQLTAGQTYTFQSDLSGEHTYNVCYVAQGDESLRPNYKLDGYDTELHLNSVTPDGNAQGYFYIPLSYGDTEVKGILTMTGGDSKNGLVEVYADAFAPDKFIKTIYINENSTSSTEVTIPSRTEKLMVRVSSVACFLGMRWQVDDTEKCTLSYNANGATSGSLPASPTEYDKGHSVEVPGNTGDLARTGYTFGGWQIDRKGHIYMPGAEHTGFVLNANTALYAVWNPINCTVSYSSETNGTLSLTKEDGTTVTSGETMPYGSTFTINVTPDEGYILDAITVNGERQNYLANGSNIVVDKALSIVATFREINPEQETTTVGSADNSSWMADLSPFVKLSSGHEIEINFEETATNEWYHSWILEISTDGEHHADWNTNSFLITSPKIDAYSPWGTAHGMTMFEHKLYNLQTGESVTSKSNILNSFYTDIKRSKVKILVTTDGTNTYIYAHMTSLENGNKWLYTLAMTHDEIDNIYVAISQDQSYLTNLSMVAKPSYLITTACEPAAISVQAHVRITTPEGITLPSGVRAGLGDCLYAVCDSVSGYNFVRWDNGLGNNIRQSVTINGPKVFKAIFESNNTAVIKAEVPEVITLAGAEHYSYGVSSNSPAPMKLLSYGRSGSSEDDNHLIFPNAEVILADNLLTIIPKASGNVSFVIMQEDYGDFSEGSTTFSIELRKRPTRLTVTPSSYIVNQGGSATLASQPVVTLTYTDDNDETQTVPGAIIQLESLNSSVATVGDGNVISFANTSQALSTDIRISYQDAAYKFADAEALLHMVVKSPSATDFITSSSDVPDVNKQFWLNTNEVLATYGGWRWNNQQYDVDGGTKTDSWKYLEGKYLGEDLVSIDGYNTSMSGTQDAKDEAMLSAGIQFGGERTGWYKQGEPYTLPCRGAYMTFEPKVSGELTVYLLQNGAWSLYNAVDAASTGHKLDEIRPGIFRPHEFFIVDENGNNVPNVQTETRECVSPEYDCTSYALEEPVNDISKDVANWNEFRTNFSVAEQQRIINAWGDNQNKGSQSVIRLDNGAYIVVQKGIVKYSFHVTAGETYYVFSNFSKLAFAGANFKADVSEQLPVVASLSLDDAVAYSAPIGKTMYRNITVNRNFTSGKWSTICLPFYMSPAEVEETFGTGTQLIMLKNVSENNNGSLHLQFVLHEMQGILAGYPYLIYSKKTLNGFSVSNKMIDPSITLHTVDAGMGYTFIGVESTVAMQKNDIYMNGSGALSTATGTKTVNVKGYRSYIHAPQEEQQSFARIRTFELGYKAGAVDKYYDPNATTTGVSIGVIDEGSAKLHTGRYEGTCSISGVRLSVPVRGIIIQDGKPVVVK